MTMPEWRRRMRAAPTYGDWWRRHCSEVVLGESQGIDKTCYIDTQQQEEKGTSGGQVERDAIPGGPSNR